MPTWRETITDALKRLGGEGSLEEIYSKLPPSRRRASNWQASVRNALQLADPDSKSFKGIAAFENRGWGIWRIRKLTKKAATKPKTKTSRAKKKR